MDQSIYHRNYAFENNHWWFTGSRRIIISQLRRYLTGGQPTLLDAGCGTGGTLELLMKMGTAYGFDAVPLAIDYCQNKRGLDNVKLGKIEEIPFKSDFFDGAIATDVIEHIPDDVKGLRELNRVLKSQGIVLVTVPAYQWLWTNHDVHHHHYRRYSAPILRQRLETAGFKVVKISYYNSFLFPAILPVRLAHKLTQAPSHDLKLPGPTLNKLLSHVFSAEKPVLDKMNFPFGLSVIAVGQKS